jgi:hypothetical protein
MINGKGSTMIHRKCFTLQWLQEKREEFGIADRGILEKSIHALALLAHLSDSGLQFVFKGGTSLLLHLNPIRRLSIDIDIVCPETPDTLNSILATIAQKPPFHSFKEADRGARGLPNRRHFHFFYNEIDGGHHESSILLDVVEDTCNLPVMTKPIITAFIDVERETTTTVPTIEGLLGDKLTAFAPNTIGVPYVNNSGISQTMQVAKQMFDIGELFNVADNMSEVFRGYSNSFKKENFYRGDSFSPAQALQDTIATCSKFCHWNLRGYENNSDITHLLDGIRKLPNHLINCNFNAEIAAKSAAAKAALISHLTNAESTDVSLSELRFTPEKIPEIKDVNLVGEYRYLQRLKNICPEAFYYWYQVEKLTGAAVEPILSVIPQTPAKRL